MNQTRAGAVAAILEQARSLTRPELLDALAARGLPTSDEELTEIWHSPALGNLAQIELLDPPLVVNLPATLVGRVFTHRLTAQEVERDELATVPDFAGIWPLIDSTPFDGLDGDPIEDTVDEVTLAPVIRLTPATLADYEADQLIAISVTNAGLHLSSAAGPPVDRLEADADMFRAEAVEVFELDQDGKPSERVGSVPLEEYLLLACVRHPDLFTVPGRPVTEILKHQELDHEDGMVAVAGFDFVTDRAENLEAEELERIAEAYELADVESLAVLAFTDKVNELDDAIHDWVEDGEPEEDFPHVEVLELFPHLHALAEPMVAVAIADESLGGDPHLGSVLAMILETVAPQTPRRAQAGWHHLLGRCQDLLSAFTEAEALYERALELDADFYPSMRELATLASLRGDAGRAVSLLLRAAVPADDPELLMVSRFVGETRTDIGRNDPCWCGSGRKYKRCHLGKSDFDLEARREWLYDKVCNWIRNGSGRELIIEIAAAVADPAAGPEGLVRAVLDPLLMDIAVFEGGLLDEFLQRRASALPTDEHELLTQWSVTRRGLYLVESIGRGARFTVRGASAGGVVEVLGGPGDAVAGDLVCLRLLRAGATLAAPGGVLIVAPEQRQLVVAVLDLQGTDEADPIRTATVLLKAEN